MSLKSNVGLAALGVTAVGAATAVWGIGIERHLYAVRRHTVAVLEPGSAPLRILHLSDVHLAPWQHHRRRWVASLAALDPDLIINTGDNLGHRDALPAIQDAFDGFRGIPGLYVHGSNDHFAPGLRNPIRYFSGPSPLTPKPQRLDTDSLDAYLVDELGWESLNNAVATVTAGGHAITGFGTSDAHRGWDQLDALPPALARARTAGSLMIGVTHAPYRRILDGLAGLGADILFAGHTHGGQVRVPGYGALVANCDIPLPQSRGLSSWRHAGRRIPLNVSAGIGHSIYAPVRFACRPEASLLTLVPRDPA